MTPKEKAEDLEHRFANVATALIVVLEIIEAIEKFGYSGTFYDCPETGNIICADEKNPTEYWVSVKHELNKL